MVSDSIGNSHFTIPSNPDNAALEPRWNERKLREFREAEECTVHRQRAGRLQKWQELVRETAKENSAKVDPPMTIQIHGWLTLAFLCFHYGLNGFNMI